LSDGGLWPKYDFDCEAKVITWRHEHGPICAASYGRANAVPAPPEHIIHLHCEDVALAEYLFNERNWTAHLLSSSSIIFTASSHSIVRSLSRFIGNNIEVVDTVFSDPIYAVQYVITRHVGLPLTSDNGNVPAQTVTSCRLDAWWHPTREAVPKTNVLDCLLGLFTSTTFDYLSSNSDIVAVLPQQTSDYCSDAVLRCAIKILGRPISPGIDHFDLTGTFRTRFLGEFLSKYVPLYRRQSHVLTPNERYALAGALFRAAYKKTQVAKLFSMTT
jgi:hypothetical protein